MERKSRWKSGSCRMRNKIRQIPRRRWVIALLIGFAGFGASGAGAAGKPEPGLLLTFAALDGDKATDVTVSPNACLYVPAAQSPTPFLPGGTFSADWAGF